MCISSLKGPPVRKQNASRNYSTFIIRNLHGKITMTSKKANTAYHLIKKKKQWLKQNYTFLHVPIHVWKDTSLKTKEKTTRVEDLGTE